MSMSFKERITGKLSPDVIKQYNTLADQFISKNSNNHDILAVVLEYNDLLVKLSKIYNSYPGKFGSISELNNKRTQLINFKRNLTGSILHAIRSDEFGRKALEGSAKTLQNAILHKLINYTLPASYEPAVPFKGINAYMLAALRYCPKGGDISQQLNEALTKIEVLKSAGADINAVDEFGRTALFYVVVGPIILGLPQHPGREEMAAKLLANGADPNLKDVYARTALDYFLLEHYPSIDSVVLLCEKMQIPVPAKIKPNPYVAEVSSTSIPTKVVNLVTYPFLALANVLNFRK